MSRITIAIPDEDRGWNLWSGGKIIASGRELTDVAGNRSDVAVAVPATLCTTFAVTLPTSDASLFDSMVYAQIEKRGLGTPGGPEETVYQYEIVHQEGSETLLSVDVLAPEFPDALCLPKAVGYAPTARLFALPENRLLLFRGHRRLVLVAGSHRRLTHMQVLSADPVLSAAAAQEINLSVLSLQGEGLIGEKAELLAMGEFTSDEDDWEAFERTLVMPGELTSEFPRPYEGVKVQGEFVPRPVRAARDRSGRARKRLLIGLVAAAVYVCAGVFLWLYAQGIKRSIADLEAEVKETRPVVDEILETEQRWRVLEPAFDLHYYPLVQLNEITKVLPASGVLIRQFETRGTSIFVRGQARDVQLAARLKEEIEGNPAFRMYQWNMPNPKVDQKNTATFEIQGEPKNAGIE